MLAVDFDPQANLTTCFGAEDVDVAIGDLMMAVIEDEELPEREEYIWERNGVDFIPSSIQLSAGADRRRGLCLCDRDQRFAEIIF